MNPYQHASDLYDGSASSLFPPAFPYRNIRGLSVIYVFLVALYGCDMNSVNVSETNIRYLENLNVGGLVKFSEFSDDDWGSVCVLVPYSGGLNDLGIEWIKVINSKIPKLNLLIDEGHWHFLFEKDGVVVADSFKRSNRLDIEQKNYSTGIKQRFRELLFTPKNCVRFSKAVIFKFERHGRKYITLGELQE